MSHTYAERHRRITAETVLATGSLACQSLYKALSSRMSSLTCVSAANALDSRSSMLSDLCLLESKEMPPMSAPRTP